MITQEQINLEIQQLRNMTKAAGLELQRYNQTIDSITAWIEANIANLSDTQRSLVYMQAKRLIQTLGWEAYEPIYQDDKMIIQANKAL